MPIVNKLVDIHNIAKESMNSIPLQPFVLVGIDFWPRIAGLEKARGGSLMELRSVDKATRATIKRRTNQKTSPKKQWRCSTAFCLDTYL
jgi:hypothetical protein